MNSYNNIILNNNHPIFSSDLSEKGINSSKLETSKVLLSILTKHLTNLLIDIQSINLQYQPPVSGPSFGDGDYPDWQDDPHFDTNIPRTPDGKIDFRALLERFEQMLEYIKTHHMNLRAIQEFFEFLYHLGQNWSQLSKEQKALLAMVMGDMKSPDGESLGHLMAILLFLWAYYSNHGDMDKARAQMREYMALLAQLDPDFLNKCNPLSDFYNEILEILNGQFDLAKWKQILKDRGLDDGDLSPEKVWLILEGILGDFLNKTDLGNWNHTGKFIQRHYYDILLQQLEEEFGSNPMLLVMAILTILFEPQSDDRQWEMAGGAGVSKYLGSAAAIFADLMEIFKLGDWSETNAKNFMEKLLEIKLRIDNDSDLPPEYKAEIDAKLNIFLGHKDSNVEGGNVSLGELWERYIRSGGKDVQALNEIRQMLKNCNPSYRPPENSQFSLGGKKKDIPSLNLYFPPDTRTQIWTQMIEALNGASQCCTDQSSVITTEINQMTNNLNQFYALMKNLWDGITKIDEAEIKNQRSY